MQKGALRVYLLLIKMPNTNDKKKKLLDYSQSGKFMHCRFFGILPAQQNII
jgi:hypothetical protein